MNFPTSHLAPMIGLSLLLPLAASAQDSRAGTGLEVADHTTVRLVVEDLHQGAQAIDLTAARIRTRVELRLRQSGLRPGERVGSEYLYVDVNVVGSGFAIVVSFHRPVYYFVGPGTTLHSFGATWDTNGAGTHGADSEYIVRNLDQLLDQFLNEYLRANRG